ncbi:MAG: phytoene desaturase family protein, partial [Bryobacteraceae bacterium]
MFRRYPCKPPDFAAFSNGKAGFKRSTPISSAAIVGSGPNGLAAAIALARTGLHTTVYEAEPIVGGGARTEDLTLPGFHHDVCSAVHPLALSSPAFLTMPLHAHGLEWIQPPIPVAHPLDDGSAAALYRNLDETCGHLGKDGPAYRRAVKLLVRHWSELMTDILQPLFHVPSHPLLLGRFGALAAWPAGFAARVLFRTKAARALFAGIAGHSVMPLDAIGSGAFGWVLAIAAHAVGWPIPRGGSQRIAQALASYFQSLGGEIAANSRITSLKELDRAKIVLLDVTPRQLLQIAGDRLPEGFSRKLENYRYGPGAFKMDWAL